MPPGDDRVMSYMEAKACRSPRAEPLTPTSSSEVREKQASFMSKPRVWISVRKAKLNPN